jgi:tetratricopeptide (TPR) repeat protein
MKDEVLHILLLLTINLLLITFGKAQDSKSIFQTANTYYQNKQYDEAAKMYLLLIKKDKKNANAYYNLGNTYFHLKQYTNAVLYYEKAKKLEPENKYINHNIQLTNNKLFSKIEFSKEFFVTKQLKNVVHAKSSESWSIFMLVAFWLSVLLMCIHFFFSKKILFKIGLTACLLSFVFAYFTYTAYKAEHQQKFAIIMQTNAFLKSAPVESMNAATAIQSGLKVEVIDTDKNWLKVKLPNDKTGWIEKNNLELI